MDRTVLHCDLNNFFASVETLLNPELKPYAIAVCGSKEQRRGIVLAKNEAAKVCGVKTAEPIWRAQQKCPQLKIVPPTRDAYGKYSKLVKAIYTDYTDQVESFGIDECYLDVTGSAHLFGSGAEIAEILRERVKAEVGLTISVGVSFNKVFAKLGSDMKKPDAVTLIPREVFKEKIWPLDSGEMLGIGPRTAQKLSEYGITSIGDVARADRDVLGSLLGKQGDVIWRYANGLDTAPVAKITDRDPPKSISHGMTTAEDLTDKQQVWELILWLAQDVAYGLREEGMYASGVSVSVRNNKMETRDFQTKLEQPTRSATLLARQAQALFEKRYDWKQYIRLVTVTAIGLTAEGTPRQSSFFASDDKTERIEQLDDTVQALRERYGKGTVQPAPLIETDKGETKSDDE